MRRESRVLRDSSPTGTWKLVKPTMNLYMFLLFAWCFERPKCRALYLLERLTSPQKTKSSKYDHVRTLCLQCLPCEMLIVVHPRFVRQTLGAWPYPRQRSDSWFSFADCIDCAKPQDVVWLCSSTSHLNQLISKCVNYMKSKQNNKAVFWFFSD